MERLRLLAVAFALVALALPGAAGAFDCDDYSGEYKKFCVAGFQERVDAGQCTSMDDSALLKAACYGLSVSSVSKCVDTLTGAEYEADDATKACRVYHDVRDLIKKGKSPNKSCTGGNAGLKSFCQAVGRASSSCSGLASGDGAACKKVARIVSDFSTSAPAFKESVDVAATSDDFVSVSVARDYKDGLRYRSMLYLQAADTAAVADAVRSVASGGGATVELSDGTLSLWGDDKTQMVSIELKRAASAPHGGSVTMDVSMGSLAELSAALR